MKFGGEYVTWLRRATSKTVREFFGPDAIQGTVLEQIADSKILDIYDQWPDFMKDYFSVASWALREKGELVPTGEQMALFTPGDGLIAGMAKGLDELYKEAKKLGPPGPPRKPTIFDDEWMREFHTDMDKWNWVNESLLTLLQNAELNPHIKALQRYIELVRLFAAEKNKYLMPVQDITKDFDALGKTRAANLSSFIMKVAVESGRKKRRLSSEELLEIAQLYKMDDAMQSVYQKVRAYFTQVLDEIETTMGREIERTFAADPEKILTMKAELQSEIDALRNRDYFPFQRFGRHVIKVLTKKDNVEYEEEPGVKKKFRHKGSVAYMEAFELKWERDARFKTLKAQIERENPDVVVGTDTLSDPQAAIMGFSPMLVDILAKDKELDLDATQVKELKQMLIEWSPGATFLKHMTRRKNVMGMSDDVRRVLNSYAMSAGSHIARLKFAIRMREQVKAMDTEASQAAFFEGRGDKRRRMAQWMDEHYKYLFNPGNELSALRAYTFTWYFAFVPKQAIVNLTQVPMVAYPWLVSTYGGPPGKADAIVSRELARAMKDVGRNFKIGKSVTKALDFRDAEKLSGHSQLEQEMVARGLEQGFLNESWATEVAGAAQGTILHRMLPSNIARHWPRAERLIRSATEFGLFGFKVSEEFNRRVTFLTAFRLAMRRGLSSEQAFRYARKAVDTTMFEYARWNRPVIMRGKKAAIFIFKTYLQHALYFYFTQPGRLRSLAVLVALGGLMALPGADDLEELISGAASLWKKKFGEGDPHVDLETDLREYIQAIGLQPDNVMNGFLRDVGGADLSSSIQLGRILPGTQPFSRLLKGTISSSEAIAQAGMEVLGAGASIAGEGVNFIRSAAQDRPLDAVFRSTIMPRAVQNSLKAAGYLKQSAAKNYRGDTLINFDLNSPAHQAEIAAQLLGAAPTRLRQMQQRRWVQREAVLFYQSWREGVLATFSRAISSKPRDREAVADARDALRRYNSMAPGPLKISGEELENYIITSTKGRALREKGLPTAQRWFRIYKSINEAYPVKGEETNPREE